MKVLFVFSTTYDPRLLEQVVEYFHVFDVKILI